MLHIGAIPRLAKGRSSLSTPTAEPREIAHFIGARIVWFPPKLRIDRGIRQHTLGACQRHAWPLRYSAIFASRLYAWIAEF